MTVHVLSQVTRVVFLLSFSTLTTAAWDPVKGNRDQDTGATKKTMIALEAFKAIPELAPFFEQADGYAVFGTM